MLLTDSASLATPPAPCSVRSFRKAYAQARIALGKRMLALGIDDGELGSEIRLVEDAIASCDAAGEDCKALRLERLHLLVKLADAALANDAPLPGADAELRRALDAQRALREQVRRRRGVAPMA